MRRTVFSVLLAGAGSVSANLEVDLNSRDSIKSAAKTVAFDLVSEYKGNQTGETPGILSQPPPAGDYYWWNGAVVWSTLLDYWRYTGDDTYNSLTSQAILFQRGQGDNFQPANWTAQLGNDDQAFWAHAAISAAEYNFPSPPAGGPSWVDLAGAVFAVQNARFDNTCNGGLRWQAPLINAGYNYKNTASNAAFLALAARLSRYTGNSTYAEAAEQTWTWLTEVGYIDDKFNVFDGAHVESNCTDINPVQFSVGAGLLLQGAAYMYNSSTGDAQTRWRNRLSPLVNRTLDQFFPDNGPFVERPCELEERVTCNRDMRFYKGIVIRQLATASELAPFLSSAITPKLKTSAEGAVKSCTGGESGRLCGFRWTGDDDSTTNGTASFGFPNQANALSALSVLLADSQKALGTGANPSSGGGNSGNGNANGNGANGNGASNNNNNGNNQSAGTSIQVMGGLLIAGLVASLF
ncbi:family 76 putative glycoside hydrolase [Cladorrhinum sp. PSN259]|nr:family 76 putative glycoside hydrolase [Cladorrhinum sp. PSN259]